MFGDDPTVRHEIVRATTAGRRLRIAHLSDLHLWFSPRKLARIDRILARWEPDVIALTGDYADTPVGRRIFFEWMRSVAAAVPVCWVAGNHDRWRGEVFLRNLETLPHAHAIDRRDAAVAAPCGRRFRFTSWERAAATTAEATDVWPTIILLHDPSRIVSLPPRDGAARLLLAGHLHGGQITLWRDRNGRPQPAAMCYKWLVDRTELGAATLIVSRGLGDTFPVRIGALREIVIVDFWG